MHFYGQWKETNEFRIYYHIDDNTGASYCSTVTYGTLTKTKTITELGFTLEDKTFLGWKAYRDYDRTWRVTNSQGSQSWSREVPDNGTYYLYSNGANAAKTTPAGSNVHFYAQWGDLNP